MPKLIYSVDSWNGGLASLRQFLKGWGANVCGQYRKDKKYLLDQIRFYDSKAESSSLSTEDWLVRNKIDEELERIYEVKEKEWHQKSQMKWIIQGDANTRFFHCCANGRKRKNFIYTLEDEGVILTEEGAIRDHIYKFYKSLFGYEVDQNVHQNSNFWAPDSTVSDTDNDSLVKNFSEAEIWEIIKSLPGDSAPGPDGSPSCFYKTFWGSLRTKFMNMVKDFFLGEFGFKETELWGGHFDSKN